MKQSVGGTYLIYFISIFILIVFAFLCAILNYMKAFKVNSIISNSLENYEGYNKYSQFEIESKLNSIGYRNGKSGIEANCKGYLHGGTFQTKEVNHEICVSEIKINDNYFRYGVTTFIYIDMPLVDEVKIPIYSESEKIYYFGK